MIAREALQDINELLEEFSSVGVLGPRQIGKTTLALEVAHHSSRKSIYLDLENASDRAKLTDAGSYFESHANELIILDEIQRAPDIFLVMRGAIDQRRRAGFKTGQFLILGSASLELLRQLAETLTGRVAYRELTGLLPTELERNSIHLLTHLFVRGGFPDSYLAISDLASLRWRLNFIATYLEKDVPTFGPRIPAITLRRLWTMLAHNQGGQLNTAKLGGNLDLSLPTVKRYIDLLEDLLLVRTLRPWAGNVAKRLARVPKLYIRDSGLTHALLNISTFDELLGHPVLGASWEGFVIENLMCCLREGITAWFYRTSGGAEIDLVIEYNRKKRVAIEIKWSTAPTVSKGFHIGCEDIEATHKFLVYSGLEKFSMGQGIFAISLYDLMVELKAL